MDPQASSSRSITQSDLERMLLDEAAEPKALPFSLLEKITNNFYYKNEIGRGGFAVVYMGVLENGVVAVKRLYDAYKYEKEFLREVESLMKVKHKNIVRFLGYCVDIQGKVDRYNGKIVMADIQERLFCFAYLPNGSLDKHIKDGSCGIEWKTCYRIIKGICEGLHYLHSINIMHLDLKPSNILMDDNMVPKITDFGVSRNFEEMQSRTVATKMIGTIGYLAPEFHTNVITRKFDLYSLGVIIMEILTGKRESQPVENVLESWNNRLELSQRNQHYEQIRVCAEIGIECIEHDPTNRPASMTHIMDWLAETERTEIKPFGLETMLSQLHDLFEKGYSNIIGVWGQGGVGKTMLLHVFNNDLEKKVHQYQVVIFIEVSNSETLNTVEIQRTISERLNLPWNDEEPIAKRARFLVKALARKRYVILLDDVRKKFRLEDVGIPTPDTNSQSKLILTSRYREICFQMNAQRSLIEMQILGNDASWKLFLSKLSKEASVAVESLGSQTREHAMKIAQSCGGLPLALSVIGTAVACLEEGQWRSAAGAIATNMDNIDGVDEMFGRLKYSYDRLIPTQQQCFLYCILFPEYGSISKEQLVDYWLAEGFLLNGSGKGYQIIRRLVSACLLQVSGSMSSEVKMHHTIRQLGFWLVNKSDAKFLVQPGMALDNAPSAGEWKEATRISIMSNNITELSFSPKCKNVTTLLIQNNPNLNKMSNGFFRTMATLKVLDLSHTAITSLPDCKTLVALEHLNLSHTHIVRLPERLWLLKELRHLDLSVTTALEDTLNNCSKLHKLKVLNLFRSRYGIRDVDDLNLDSLKEQLLFLGITIYAEDVLKKLNMPGPLAKSTHRLNLKYCADMQSIKISDLGHMEHLEELYVQSCYDLNTVVADAELTTSQLQFLTLSVLPSLQSVVVAPMPHNFQYICKLIISQCPKLLNITWVRRLRLLERLFISHCDGMLEFFEDREDEEQCGEQLKVQGHASDKQEDHAIVETSRNDTGQNDFPKLRLIALTQLKKLSSICKPREFPCLETLRVEECPNLRSIPLSCTRNYGKLKQICGSFEWWGKLQWENWEEAAYVERTYFIPI
ncbi:disease resistance protein RPS2 isoform X2 [Aegilops tauschii subsp. strangulata]|uniref:disease resistance protein RPS2 isoform X2 n=1 Tax=Aegilops tauschii subsp. strangulata TaxID=200361 RepID=UPI00098BB21C|nr:disease resistance protein RPS2 isoform X2 [Aegilops tauschii subsp. strangulata]XP_020195858.1 disease resistance protein RPS2 isoform X2 [Aegilops tauschii subsp. strangulata]